MITIGITEKSDEIKDLLLSIFSKKGFSFCENKIDEECDYAIFYGQRNFTCDIVLGAGEMADNTLEANYVYIFNSDMSDTVCVPKKALIISYGLNSLATVTASSINDDGEMLCFQYCLQRSIPSLSGKIVEPQEFPVRICSKEAKIYSALSVVTLAMVCDILTEEFFNF